MLIFMCLLLICIPTLEEYLLISFAYILIVLFVFLLLSCNGSLCIPFQESSPLSNIWFANIFSHSVACLFTFLLESWAAQNFLILVKSDLSIFSFVTCAFGVVSKEGADFLT